MSAAVADTCDIYGDNHYANQSCQPSLSLPTPPSPCHAELTALSRAWVGH